MKVSQEWPIWKLLFPCQNSNILEIPHLTSSEGINMKFKQTYEHVNRVEVKWKGKKMLEKYKSGCWTWGSIRMNDQRPFAIDVSRDNEKSEMDTIGVHRI